MAKRYGKLPSFKGTQRSTSGKVTHRLVLQGCHGEAVQQLPDTNPGIVLDGAVPNGETTTSPDSESYVESTTSPDSESLPTLHQVI